VKAFAELLDRLAYTPSRNDKLRLLAGYFASAPDVARDMAPKAMAVPKRNDFMSLPPR